VKFQFIILETKSPAWVEQARDEYVAKISGFVNFEIVRLKSPHVERDNSEVKRKKEADLILKHLDSRDHLVLFDEAGKSFKQSEDFAVQLSRVHESGKNRAIFVIGGPYGFSDDVKKRSQSTWSLSGLTLNHWVAQITALEQIYRGFTIIKGIPYHNR
jgi:23S rRNA (pseudouridine1915-N3)-methyltransferase